MIKVNNRRTLYFPLKKSDPFQERHSFSGNIDENDKCYYHVREVIRMIFERIIEVDEKVTKCNISVTKKTCRFMRLEYIIYMNAYIRTRV